MTTVNIDPENGFEDKDSAEEGVGVFGVPAGPAAAGEVTSCRGQARKPVTNNTVRGPRLLLVTSFVAVQAVGPR